MFGVDSLGQQPCRAGALVESSQFLQKSRFLWVWFLKVKAEVASVLRRRKFTTSFLFSDGHGTGLYFSLVVERIGFLVPVSFLTNRNWHDSSQTLISSAE